MPATTAPSNGQRTFEYRARSVTGRVVKGKVPAANEAGVVAQLSAQGLSPVHIHERAEGTGLNREIELLPKRVKAGDLAMVTRQLATMTQSGLPLLRAIAVVADQTTHPKLHTVLQDVARDVEIGSSFSDAMAKHRQFPPILVSMIRAGEAGGFLDLALSSAATMFEKEAKLRATIKSAMAYPVVVLLITLVAVFAMLIFIVPVFSKMFSSFGSSLPLPTQILVTASNQMWWAAPLLAVLAIAGSITWNRVKDRTAVKRIVHPLMLRIPVFGPLLKKVAVSRFARNLSNMTAAGVPMLRALTIVGEASGNWSIEQVALRTAEAVRAGGTMTDVFSKEKLFPTMVVQMVAIGEESGSVDAMLAKIADFYDNEIDATAAALTSLIEPLLITVLGVVVGGMVVALYMPIFSIATAVK